MDSCMIKLTTSPLSFKSVNLVLFLVL